MSSFLHGRRTFLDDGRATCEVGRLKWSQPARCLATFGPTHGALPGTRHRARPRGTGFVAKPLCTRDKMFRLCAGSSSANARVPGRRIPICREPWGRICAGPQRAGTDPKPTAAGQSWSPVTISPSGPYEALAEARPRDRPPPVVRGRTVGRARQADVMNRRGRSGSGDPAQARSDGARTRRSGRESATRRTPRNHQAGGVAQPNFGHQVLVSCARTVVGQRLRRAAVVGSRFHLVSARSRAWPGWSTRGRHLSASSARAHSDTAARGFFPAVEAGTDSKRSRPKMFISRSTRLTAYRARGRWCRRLDTSRAPRRSGRRAGRGWPQVVGI